MEEKELYCYMCGNTVNTDDLVVWKHPEMDGGRPYEVCPVCAKRVKERNMDDDFYTAFALSRSFVPCGASETEEPEKRVVTIDGEDYQFTACDGCPLHMEDEDGDTVCMHPKGVFTEPWQEMHEWKEDGTIGRLKPNYFPNGCPARRMR